MFISDKNNLQKLLYLKTLIKIFYTKGQITDNYGNEILSCIQKSSSIKFLTLAIHNDFSSPSQQKFPFPLLPLTPNNMLENWKNYLLKLIHTIIAFYMLSLMSTSTMHLPYQNNSLPPMFPINFKAAIGESLLWNISSYSERGSNAWCNIWNTSYGHKMCG